MVLMALKLNIVIGPLEAKKLGFWTVGSLFLAKFEHSSYDTKDPPVRGLIVSGLYLANG